MPRCEDYPLPGQDTFQSRAIAIAVTVLLHTALIFFVLHMALRTGIHLNPGNAADTSIQVSILRPPAPQPAAALTPAHHLIARAAPPPATSGAGPTQEQAPENSVPSAAVPVQADASQADLVIGATPAEGGATADFRDRLLAYIARYQNYPASARAARIEGRVILAFVLARDGTVSNLRITQSSGSSILDRSALDTIMRAQPLPTIPKDLSDRLEIELPIDYNVRY